MESTDIDLFDKYELIRCFDEILLLELFKDLYTFYINKCKYHFRSFYLKDFSDDEIANIKFILNNFYYPLKKITYEIDLMNQSKVFPIITENNKQLLQILKLLLIHKSMNEMRTTSQIKIKLTELIYIYIIDYNIEYFINLLNIPESTCIEINLNNSVNISLIINYMLTQNNFGDFKFDEIIDNLYNKKYDFRLLFNSMKQKYLKYKTKYLQLKMKF
jgi:hypothetical protein